MVLSGGRIDRVLNVNIFTADGTATGELCNITVP